jgi:hypothetical protein
MNYEHCLDEVLINPLVADYMWTRPQKWAHESQMWCSEGSKVGQTHYRIINSPVSSPWIQRTILEEFVPDPEASTLCSQTGPLRYLLHFNSSKAFKSKQTHHTSSNTS